MKFRIASDSLMMSAALVLLFVPARVGAQQQAEAGKAALYSKASSATAKPGATPKPTPRAANGHPDLDGIWYHSEPGPPVELRNSGTVVYQFPGIEKDPTAKIEVGTDHTNPATNNMPAYKPEYLAKVKELNATQIKTDPAWSCFPPGVPRIGPPQQIVQSNKEIVFLYADLNGSFYRVVPIDGRPRESVHRIDRSYLGDSYGHWEGDTLVVDVDNMNDDTWLSDNGLFHSTSLHVTERLTRKGDDLMYEVTAEDPKVLTKPWVWPSRTLSLSQEPVYEAPPCIEQDGAHLTSTEHHDNVR